MRIGIFLHVVHVLHSETVIVVNHFKHSDWYFYCKMWD